MRKNVAGFSDRKAHQSSTRNDQEKEGEKEVVQREGRLQREKGGGDRKTILRREEEQPSNSGESSDILSTAE